MRIKTNSIPSILITYDLQLLFVCGVSLLCNVKRAKRIRHAHFAEIQHKFLE